MADSSHLERMGRELKCPICLSLLSSAVSLTCNHAFCCSCIKKSMKSVSNCPVCKVPFQRREIRPAPHMDNLVSIYKSMEIASGINIFVTQTAASTKISDPENQHHANKVCGVQESGKSGIEPASQENQKISKEKGCRRSSKARPVNTCIDAEKPSFPTKKRVHVPQFPPSETQTQSAKSKIGTFEVAKSVTEESSRMQKDKLKVNENEAPEFAPFFWLRDDAEKVTQQTDQDLILETPPDVPCFSDIKDSDDEIPCGSTPNRVTDNASSEAEFFDSEMFEWTQRPCSPELHSSPMRMQVEDTSECVDRNRYASENAAALLKSSVERRDIAMSEMENGKADLISSPSPRQKFARVGSKNSSKRGRKAVQESKNKRSKRNANEASQAPKESETLTGQHKRKKLEDEGNASYVITKSRKKKQSGLHVTKAASETLCSISGTDPADISCLSDTKKYRSSSINKWFESSEAVSLQKGLGSNSKTIKVKAVKDSMKQHQCESHLPKISSSEGKEVFHNGLEIRRCKIKSDKKEKDIKRVKFSEESNTRNNLIDNSQSWGFTEKVNAEDTQKLAVVQGNSNAADLCQSSGVECAPSFSKSIQDGRGKSTNSILCAFCRSAEESEATGIMVHYLEGKPVTGEQIRESNVIHSHKNCSEWAPNVFFQEDKAINLDAELTRSRRIKCCFCGIKGAALGCYAKSCRKSFHVPCAKLTPECRWDNYNFVMLCPVHASNKLPCELHVSQSHRKRKSLPERSSDFQRPNLVREENKADSLWKSHIQSKSLVLCCSGLTEIEKGIISEFQKLSEVKVLKNWDPIVTHVIASTDENGACKRTLKFLMGVLEGKWILTTEWVQACIKSKGLVDEKYYEIEVDVHGIRNGPTLGRLRLLNKKPKLFNEYKFYFMGDYASLYKRYLQDLVIAGGGTILNRKPIPEGPESSSGSIASKTFIIYSLELLEKCEPLKANLLLQRRCSDAKALANSTGTTAVSNSWILNSIAGCKLQSLTE